LSTEQEISTNAKLEDLVRKYNLKFLDEYSTDLMPVIVQDFATNEVLMLGFANLEAVRTTFRKKLATFWSRSRSRLWTKGETSGNFLTLVEM
jgi:phosphoribosyl-ATP pyrophosphohydrolase/phosphoribosyl-AMP cyclohydrolase